MGTFKQTKRWCSHVLHFLWILRDYWRITPVSFLTDRQTDGHTSRLLSNQIPWDYRFASAQKIRAWSCCLHTFYSHVLFFQQERHQEMKTNVWLEFVSGISHMKKWHVRVRRNDVTTDLSFLMDSLFLSYPVMERSTAAVGSSGLWWNPIDTVARG